MTSNLEFKTLFDNGKSLCFIGSSHSNREMFNYFEKTRPCETISYEDILTKDPNWVSGRQFIATSASIQFKKAIIDGICHLNPNYFSVYSTQNHIGFNVTIGRGVLIHAFNTILDDVVIGDHSMITTHTNLSYLSKIKDFCHIGPYSQVLAATLGSGCYLAARTSIVGKKDAITEISDYCNFIIGSTVTKTIDLSGTYYGNKRIDTITSLDKKID
jgi:acetyltransferase-like isoleucine patch superfamily enzyme